MLAATFSCIGCIFYRPDGWALFKSAHGTPIRQGKCRQYHFYTIEAAKSACGGRLKKEQRPNPSPAR